MSNEIHDALLKLEDSLNKLKSATDLIEETNGNAQEVIMNSSYIFTEISGQVNGLNKYFDNWIQDFDKKTNSTLGEYTKIWQEHNLFVQKTIENYKNLGNNLRHFIESLENTKLKEDLNQIKTDCKKTIERISVNFDKTNNIENKVKSYSIKFEKISNGLKEINTNLIEATFSINLSNEKLDSIENLTEDTNKSFLKISEDITKIISQFETLISSINSAFQQVYKDLNSIKANVDSKLQALEKNNRNRQIIIICGFGLILAVNILLKFL